MLDEEMNYLDTELKGLFIDKKFEEMKEYLKERSDETVKELTDYNWGIIKKYYDAENFQLLYQHYKFVAYTCFLVEYTHKRTLISNEAFGIMMQIYNDIYESNKQFKQ